MKKITYIFTGFICMIGMHAFTQSPPEIQWSKCFGGSGSQTFLDIHQTTDGGYIACGSFDPEYGDTTVPLYSNFWVVKIDASSDVEWQRSYGGSNIEGAATVTENSEGGFVVAGVTWSTDGDVSGAHGGPDIWVLKLDAFGNLIWQKCLGGSGGETASSVIETSDGNYLLVGKTDSNDGDVTGFHIPTYYGDDYWVVKLSPAGNIIWAKCYGGYDYDIAGSVIETSDGNYVVAGWTSSNDGDVSGNHGEQDAWILKINTSGDIIWQKTYGMTEADYAFDIAEDGERNLVFAGHSKSNFNGYHGGFDYWMMKLNKKGNVIWSRVFGGTHQDHGTDVIVLNDGTYVMGGWAHSLDGDVVGSHKHNDYWIVGVDPVGNMLWTDALGGRAYDFMYCLAPTSDNGFIISGGSESTNGNVHDNYTGTQEAWTAKFVPGNDRETNVVVTDDVIIYPNPFNTKLNIAPSNTSDIISAIKITDASGRSVKELNYGNGGTYPVVVQTDDLLPGIYFIELFFENQVIIQTVVKL